ncbi:MAG: PstS family phosphate ABC transporter substrate-binding protein [Candidatus Omnitrophica bacterium]|nr:PstS family phosphate ABC transporter substrate-binding protein [Candidatus Omnitrophota bacterium]
MKKSRLMVLALIVLASFGLTASAESITIKGSTTVLPIAQACAEEFMDLNPGASISVGGGGSGVGIASILDGTADIGDASRPIKDKELELAVSMGVKPKANVVAMDGIAVIVHPSNKITELSKAQLKDIYTGKFSDWSQLGMAGGKIVVVSRDTASGTYEAFMSLALNKAKTRSDSLLQASNQAVSTTVSKTPGAIGYVGLGYVSDSVKAVTVNGVVASKETVLSGQYLLSRPLFMYTNGQPKGLVKEYIDFVLSATGQRLAEENGYVGLK